MTVMRKAYVSAYHPTLSSFAIGFAFIPVLILLTWPAALLLGDARVLIVEFVIMPLISVVGLGSVLHGFSFVFDDDRHDLTIQRRILLFRVGDAVRTTFSDITEIDWTDGGDGTLYLTVNSKARYAVTQSRAKAKRIEQMITRVHPNLHAQHRT